MADKDSGNSWSDLQESTDFVGVNSSNLRIYNSKDEWIGWKFRLQEILQCFALKRFSR